MKKLAFLSIFILFIAHYVNAEKSLEAVFYPDKFEPFLHSGKGKIPDFGKEWETNKYWILANMAHASYLSKDRIIKIVSDFNPEIIKVYEKDGAEAFLSVWTDKAIVSYRGTQPDSLNDLRADMTFIPEAMGSAKVHKGFLQELNKIWNDIEKDLIQYTKSKAIPVWATGHSLGGALATLSGMRFQFEEIVTFGEPRLGLDIDSMFIAKRHVRVINGNDPIALITNYPMEHHGSEIRIQDEGGETDWRYDHSIIYYAQNLDLNSKKYPADLNLKTCDTEPYF